MSNYLLIKPLSLLLYAPNHHFNDEFPVGTVLKITPPKVGYLYSCHTAYNERYAISPDELKESFRKLK